MSGGVPIGRATALSVHAGFQCGRSGACCSAGWAIPIDQGRGAQIERALACGHLETPGFNGSVPFERATDRPDGSGPQDILAHAADGACAFFDRQSRRCAIQVALGHAALPLACQHFPRICLIDDRGLSISLSHVCPTAAAGLFDPPGPLTIVTDPPMLETGVEWEGLDARGEWPPLLRAGCLMDLESYDAWERLGVAIFAREDLSAESALDLLAKATERIRTWSPSPHGGSHGESLDERIAAVAAWCAAATPPLGGRPPSGRSAAECRRVDPIPDRAWHARAAAFEMVRQSVEPGITVPPLPDVIPGADRRWVDPAWLLFSWPVRRYLAARLFASWLAYQGRGLRTVVAGVRLALDLVRIEAARACIGAARQLDRALLLEAIRAADRLLLHDASREELARRLDAMAEPPARTGGVADFR